jgi:D-aminoacyl-tRNA deacylase
VPPPYLVVLSLADPVAQRVHQELGALPAADGHVDGAPVRLLPDGTPVLARPALHIEEDRLEDRLPAAIQATRPTLVFPSIHQSESGLRCFTAHPIGNLGEATAVGGEPRTLAPAPARLMTDALRRLDEGGRRIGLRATFEATHHGPATRFPACFVEIGYGTEARPPADAVRTLTKVLRELREDDADRIVVGVGGGHYAPHFTDLALRRRWAFGHIVPRHALQGFTREDAERATRATPGAEGTLVARAADLKLPSAPGFPPRLAEGVAPRRPDPAGHPPGGPTRSTGASRSSGT